MAKEKLVAKMRFDDGSKRGVDGKSADYNIGEVYVGDAEGLKAAKGMGLVCSESELKASKEVVNEKDRAIQALESKLEESRKTIGELEHQVADLKAQLAEKEKGKKPDPKKD